MRQAPVDNLNLAFEVAESHFDVPRLLDADQMVAAPDEQARVDVVVVGCCCGLLWVVVGCCCCGLLLLWFFVARCLVVAGAVGDS